MAQLQIPAVSPFSPHGDPGAIAQKWVKWIKSFEYFVIASGITDDARKRALLLHLVGQETQDIFERFTATGTTFAEALTKLIFLLRKMYRLKDLFFTKQNKNKEKA